MTILPPDIDYADKFVWGVVLDGEMVGCADVIRGWPSVDTAHIGLLLLDEANVGRGLGRAAYDAIEAQVRWWPQVYTLRLAIVATNAEVVAFWHQATLTAPHRSPYPPSKSDPSAGFNPVSARCRDVWWGVVWVG